MFISVDFPEPLGPANAQRSFARIVNENRQLPPGEIRDLVLAAVTEFMGDAPFDDLTLLVIKIR